MGAAQLAIHVEGHVEHREAGYPSADRGHPQQAHDDEQQQHEADRISDEDEMVIGVEPPAERVEQPQEGNRQRNQRPGEFIGVRSEEHTSELQSLMRTSYAVFCLKKKTNK